MYMVIYNNKLYEKTLFSFGGADKADWHFQDISNPWIPPNTDKLKGS